MILRKKTFLALEIVALVAVLVILSWVAYSSSSSSQKREVSNTTAARTTTTFSDSPVRAQQSNPPVLGEVAPTKPLLGSTSEPISSFAQSINVAQNGANDTNPVNQISIVSPALNIALPKAKIVVNGQTFEQSVNQIGVFPQIQIQPREQVSVHLTYPTGRAGNPVAVQVQDGGHLILEDGHTAMSQVATINQQNAIDFQFQATQQLGIYRISVRDGANVSVVNLWAGNLPEVRQ